MQFISQIVQVILILFLTTLVAPALPSEQGVYFARARGFTEIIELRDGGRFGYWYEWPVKGAFLRSTATGTYTTSDRPLSLLITFHTLRPNDSVAIYEDFVHRMILWRPGGTDRYLNPYGALYRTNNAPEFILDHHELLP